MEQRRSKGAQLLLVQLDSITGEQLGAAVEYLYACGAKNVQMIPTVTKKNRPGEIVLIDAPFDAIPDIEAAIVTELGATGWHVIGTEHRYVPVEYLEKELCVRCGEKTFSYRAKAKWTPCTPEIFRPESDCCLELRRLLAGEGKNVSYEFLYQKLQDLFRHEEETELILQ